MKFSEMWIREWINPPISSIELVDQLTMAGFKVNELKPVINIFYGVIIGEIVECKMHPNVNNMWIIKVNKGNNELLNIVCAASNCRKNIRVVVAKVGAVLPNGRKIKTKTIHGKESEGILCTFSTFGIINHTVDIIELPTNAPIGENFYNYLRFNDNIIEINVTPNRGDCLSIIGISREIAAINHLKLKKIKIEPTIPTINDTIPISVEIPDACPQYLGRIIKNIHITAPTPLWITEKLRRCGICSVNIVVDIINYVLLELGQPIHVFDYTKIDGNIIRIRFSEIGEILTLSNHNNLKLSQNTIIISDRKKPLSIAGAIIPNKYSVCSETRHIMLQSAVFTPSTIASQSILHPIHDLYSFRYVRGIDPSISQLALDRVTSLLLKNCGGCPGPIVNITNKNILPKPINIILNRTKLDKIIGFHIIDSEITHILRRFGFQIKFSDNIWKVLPPTWRFDISIEENLISEITRIYGYNNIPRVSICTNLITDRTHSSTIPLSRIKNLLVDRGYQEIITYSFVSSGMQKLLHPKKIPLILKNPITLEMSTMRLSLWSGLIKTVIYNQNRQQKQIKLFESGICFIPQKNFENQVYQDFMIAGIRSGLRFNEHWDLKKIHPVDFYDIKGDVEALLNLTNKLHCIRFKKYTHPALHSGQSAAIYLENICIGYIGMIHPSIQMTLNLRSQTLVFELSWNMISQFILSKVTSISKFPKNFRDISIIVPNKVSAESIIAECKKIDNKDQLVDIKLSDVYKSKNIEKGFKSFTIKLYLQSKTHTLKEEEISDIVNKCSMILKKRFNGTLR
ncbi:phenylalanine--tRNA ligase subunit beta [Blochmannia endosymbiont of Camponotus sp. C-046]|uniref:phenylalanine--tRNA ligase subunit beta n=1 Tax=Blochmannia endosymbiont of Camponotus sp. C-046 TaxID=2945589 RepID=UPI002024E808|nr:phenylalanine--tRNA ligase subunit beta [Blochmannia endosymbiont of Camponotus sp. C-046]URJ28931.1 phenylalanine--tRNA ligase subunit beta [Blochmannia endosymbiont of Camponotus sp. C-046]